MGDKPSVCAQVPCLKFSLELSSVLSDDLEGWDRVVAGSEAQDRGQIYIYIYKYTHTHTYLHMAIHIELIHFVVQQKPTHCKAITLQYKKTK